MCESKELIVGYVYDELSTDERAAFGVHLAGCPECRIEIEELRTTREHLALWAPPVPDLGFRVISGGAAPAAALPRRSRFVPAFAFAAAAVIVLAVAAAIANVEVRYGSDGMTVRTGWASHEAPGTVTRAGDQLQAQPVSDQSQASASGSGDFAELDRRLREIESTLTGAPGGGTVQAASVSGMSDSGMSDAELLRRVRQMVSEAEARQETAVARLLLDVVRDFDHQRRADIAVIQQGIGQYQGLANLEIAQNRDKLNQLVLAATRQEK